MQANTPDQPSGWVSKTYRDYGRNKLKTPGIFFDDDDIIYLEPRHKIVCAEMEQAQKKWVKAWVMKHFPPQKRLSVGLYDVLSHAVFLWNTERLVAMALRYDETIGYIVQGSKRPEDDKVGFGVVTWTKWNELDGYL